METQDIHIKLANSLHTSCVRSVCWWQALKLDLSEVFAVYVSFATELEEQSKQLLEKVEQVSASLNDQHGDEVQSKYLSVEPLVIIRVASLTTSIN